VWRLVCDKVELPVEQPREINVPCGGYCTRLTSAVRHKRKRTERNMAK